MEGKQVPFQQETQKVHLPWVHILWGGPSHVATFSCKEGGECSFYLGSGVQLAVCSEHLFFTQPIF